MNIKTLVTIIFTTLGVVLAAMAGHDLFLPDLDPWLAGIKGTSLTITFAAGVACIVLVLAIHVVTGLNTHLYAVKGKPKKEKREYYGPGADSFNGAYGDRDGGGADVQSMVRGAFATQAPPAEMQTPIQQPVSYETTPIPVVVPQRTNDAVDPLAFVQSGETPAGAAASANPLYGGIVEKKATTNVSNYPGQSGNVNYDPAYGGGTPQKRT
ncbi:MAG: hypothetical protein K6E50_14220 [Lachnospiraceae bacterium]|nr:hypothetical protein [Lachnospiraceae bacterium]